jgi:DNA-binding CsgD family transcriptional regulator
MNFTDTYIRNRLSAKEYEVVSRLSEGHKAPAIAKMLFRSEKTVWAHIMRAKDKFGITTAVEWMSLLKAVGRDIVSADKRYYTIADLKKDIANLPDQMWVCLDGGPLNNVVMEPGASEPFILLRHINDATQTTDAIRAGNAARHDSNGSTSAAASQRI